MILERPRLLTVADYLEIGEVPSGYTELTEGRLSWVPSTWPDHSYAGSELGCQLGPQLPPGLQVVHNLDALL